MTNSIESKNGAYFILHSETGRIYAGSSLSVNDRVTEHKRYLRNGTHFNKELQEAYNSDQKLETFTTNTPDRESAFALEQVLLDTFKDTGFLFNRSTQAKNSFSCMVFDEARIEQMRQASLGKKASEETKLRMSISAKGKNLGKKKDPEVEAQLQVKRLEKARKVVVEGVEYESLREASRVLGMGVSSVDYRIRSKDSKYSEWKDS